jgi:hypothetical protein
MVVSAVALTTIHPIYVDVLLSILLWYRKKYIPKDNLKLLGGWMRPRSFSFIVNTEYIARSEE